MVEWRLQKVVVIGGSDVGLVDDGGQDGKGLLLHKVLVSTQKTPLMQLSMKTGWCEVLSNIKADFISHQSFVFSCRDICILMICCMILSW